MKVLILDSGPIINLSLNGLLYIFEKIKSEGLEIVITQAVKEEVIDYPLKIKRFELGALRVQQLLAQKVIKLPEDIGFSSEEIKKETAKVMSVINSTLKADGDYIKIVSDAESSCLAMSKMLSDRGTANMIGIDERTTRTLFEKPENLEDLMSRKLHKKIKINNDNFRSLGNFRFIRSPEIVFVAYKKGITNLPGSQALEALLYATKYKGSSISDDEIKVLKKL